MVVLFCPVAIVLSCRIKSLDDLTNIFLAFNEILLQMVLFKFNILSVFCVSCMSNELEGGSKKFNLVKF